MDEQVQKSMFNGFLSTRPTLPLFLVEHSTQEQLKINFSSITEDFKFYNSFCETFY